MSVYDGIHAAAGGSYLIWLSANNNSCEISDGVLVTLQHALPSFFIYDCFPGSARLRPITMLPELPHMSREPIPKYSRIRYQTVRLYVRHILSTHPGPT